MPLEQHSNHAKTVQLCAVKAFAVAVLCIPLHVHQVPLIRIPAVVVMQ
jgi:hypothetical protein